ncbi:MAG: hypothetical protein ACYC1Q_03395 [Bacteroidia bacterium]
MKKINYTLLIVLTVAMAFISSCKKDETTDPVLTCQLTKMDLTVFGTTVTSTITYNTSGQPIDMQTNDNGTISGTLYTYTSSGKVASMSEYDGAAKTVTARTDYTYGANGVTEEKMYVDNAGTLELDGVNRFDYNGTQRIQKNIFSIVGGQETKTDYVVYSYAANGDVSGTVTFTDDGLGNFEQSTRNTYTYNDKMPTRFLAGLISEDPNFPSTHYITRNKEEDYKTITQAWEVSSDLDYAYTFDSDNKPTKINVGQGLFVFDLFYTCK